MPLLRWPAPSKRATTPHPPAPRRPETRCQQPGVGRQLSDVPDQTILHTIVEHKRIEVAARKAAHAGSPLAGELTGREAVRDFRAALADPARPAPRLIAEIKRRSPSKGPLRAGLD